MKKKISLLLLLATALLLYFCAKQPVAPDKTPDGFMKISISSSKLFQDNSHGLLNNLSRFNRALKRNAAADTVQVLSKQQALIQFKEAKVMVMNATNAFRYWAGLAATYDERRLIDYYCQVDRNNYDAFYGKDLEKWDALVSSMSQYLGLELVYNGSLAKSGENVEGDILVKPGLNLVFICFINSAGHVFWTSGAEYIYQSSIFSDLNLDSTGSEAYQEADGWVADTEYAWNPVTYSYDSILAIHVWEDEQFIKQTSYPDYYSGCPSYTYYYIPKIGYLGISREYAECECAYEKRRYDSLTHFVQPPIDTSHSNTWKTVGATGFTQGTATLTSLQFPASGGFPFVAYADQGQSNRAVVRQYNGASWNILGGVLSTGKVTALSLAMLGNSPYVAYNDSADGNSITVKRWNVSAWAPVGIPAFSPTGVTDLSMVIDPTLGYIYVGFNDTVAASGLTVMRFNGTSWDTVGTPGFTSGPVTGISMALNSARELHAAFADGKNGNMLTVMKYVTGWAQVGIAGFSFGTTRYITLAFGVADTPYVAYDDGMVRVQKFDGSSWIQVGSVPLSYSMSGGVSMKIGCGKIRVAISDGYYSYYATAYELTASDNWTTIGIINSISSNSIGAPSIDNDPITCMPHIAYPDGNYTDKLTVKYFGQ